MDVFWAAPPVTRTLTAATLATSLLVHSQLVSATHVIFYLPWIVNKFPPQIWRLITPFLLTGKGLDFLFDLYFLYTYGIALEVESPALNQPGDFFIYVIFVAATILVLHAWLITGFIFLHSLILGFAYTFAQENKGKKVSFFVITIPVQFLPYAMLAMTLVMGGPQAALSQGSGLIGAHLFYFLTLLYPVYGGGTNFIQTPAFVRSWFSSGNGRNGTNAVRAYGTAYTSRSRNESSTSSSSGFSSGLGPVSNLWSNRGAGRRLGE